MGRNIQDWEAFVWQDSRTHSVSNLQTRGRIAGYLTDIARRLSTRDVGEFRDGKVEVSGRTVTMVSACRTISTERAGTGSQTTLNVRGLPVYGIEPDGVVSDEDLCFVLELWHGVLVDQFVWLFWAIEQ